MIFDGHLDEASLVRMRECDQDLHDPDRLRALAATGLIDSPREEAFDRLVILAARLLDVPLTNIALVSESKQFFKAAYGLPSSVNAAREIPIDQSICRYTLHKEPIICSDARLHPMLKFHPSVKSWGLAAIVALPLITPAGFVIGAFCAVDIKPRIWSDDDLSTLRELTACVMTELNLRQRIIQLEADTGLRERLLITLSHDLRNPIAVAKMASELATEPGASDGDRELYRSMVSENLERADQMIQQLLNDSRDKHARAAVPTLDETNLVDLIKLSVENQKSVYGKRFDFSTNRERLPGTWIANNLHRIVDNLVGNAIKYGDPGARVQIELRALEKHVDLRVTNQGNPIAPAELRDLFQMFSRSEAAVRGSQAGWGIGLAVVKGLVDEMNGRVHVESHALHGTTFTVSLGTNG